MWSGRYTPKFRSDFLSPKRLQIIARPQGVTWQQTPKTSYWWLLCARQIQFLSTYFLKSGIILSPIISEVMWSELTWFMCKWFCSEWSEVGYGEVFRDKGTTYIRVTVYWGYLMVLWLFHVVRILCCGCFNWFCYVWVCVCVDFCNVWLCVCVDFVMCGCVYVWIL